MSTATVKHTPGDINHQFLAAAGYDFCTRCGCSLRGKRTVLETELLKVLEAIDDFWGDCEGEQICPAPVYAGAYLTNEDRPIREVIRAIVRKAKGTR